MREVAWMTACLISLAQALLPAGAMGWVIRIAGIGAAGIRRKVAAGFAQLKCMTFFAVQQSGTG